MNINTYKKKKKLLLQFSLKLKKKKKILPDKYCVNFMKTRKSMQLISLLYSLNVNLETFSYNCSWSLFIVFFMFDSQIFETIETCQY